MSVAFISKLVQSKDVSDAPFMGLQSFNFALFFALPCSDTSQRTPDMLVIFEYFRLSENKWLMFNSNIFYVKRILEHCVKLFYGFSN